MEFQYNDPIHQHYKDDFYKKVKKTPFQKTRSIVNIESIKLSNPSITRLAREAGIERMRGDTFDTIQDVLKTELYELLEVSSTIQQNKVLSVEDIKKTLSLLHKNVLSK